MADNNEPAAAAAAAPLPPVAVMPAPANNNRILLTVCLWATVNTGVFSIVALIADHTHCTKWTWVFRCLALSDTAAAELSALFDRGLCCSTAAGLAAALYMMLTEKKTRCSCWAVDALAWVALAATAGVHGTEIATGTISLAAGHPEDDTYFYVHVFLASICLIVAIAGLLLSAAAPLVVASWVTESPSG